MEARLTHGDGYSYGSNQKPAPLFLRVECASADDLRTAAAEVLLAPRTHYPMHPSQPA